MKPINEGLFSPSSALHAFISQHSGFFPGLGHFHDHQPPDSNLQFRSIDGTQNNLTQPDVNATGTDFTRVGPANFADGISTPVDGPNPREISNIVVAGGPDPDNGNPDGLSDLMYVWGQFIDHDLDLMKQDPAKPFNVIAPANDPNFPGATIPVDRVVTDQNTGTSAANPLTAVNNITGWLDGSMVYGSDAATAASLRLPDGHMKTSAGGNLPIGSDGMFMAGDVRAAENPDLTAMQTLFVREHNFQVDQLHQQHPNWTGEQLYQNAKAIVTGEIENITYKEFLPHLLGPNAIAPYHGYNPNVSPTITEEFAGAAYRFGHSIVSGGLGQINEQGVSTNDQALKDAFFEPASQFVAQGGADSLLRSLPSEQSPPLDSHIIDDLRNFLSVPPDAIDLAATNIERGRDLGLGTLNETRAALGLEPFKSFADITSNPDTQAALAAAFGDVNKVDLWTGGLSEDHAPGAMVGTTFQKIIGDQFTALRDGDRLFFENQGFDSKTLKAIEGTTLSDIIVRNTAVDHLQQDAFVATERHSGTAGPIPAADNPDGPQLVIGSQGVDTLLGGPKNDVLVAATGGVQTMSGFNGADQFVLPQGVNAVITDFTPGTDSFKLEGVSHVNLRSVHLVADHGNTIIEGNHDHVVLLGVLPSQLHGFEGIA
jgi:peroxidase